MITYSIMIITSLLLSYVSTKIKNKKPKIFFQILSALPFIIVSGIRYDVGTDYLYRYAPDYLIIGEGDDVLNLEILVKLLLKFCNLITKDYFLFFAITSVITNGLIFYSIYKYSRKPVLSIFIYFISSSFFFSLNLVRQYLSISIIILAFMKYYNDNGKKRTLLLTILFASLIHSSSLIFIPLVFFNNKKNNDILLIVLSIMIFLLGQTSVKDILKLFSNFKDINLYKYNVYSRYDGNMPISSLIVETCVYIYYCTIYYRKKIDEKNMPIAKFYINLQWFSVLFTLACFTNELFIRLCAMNSAFQILSLPYFYSLSIEQNKKNGIKNYRTFIILLFICTLMFSRMYYSTIMKHSMEVIPYKTIFERPSDIKEDVGIKEYLYNRSYK